MAQLARESELIRLAIRNAEQLQEVVQTVEVVLAACPADAKALIRPCGILVQKLLEGQASVEGLIQKIYSAERSAAGSKNR